MTWALAAISLIATFLNARKVRWCFALWIITNAGWSAWHFSIGNHARAVLDACYFGLAIYGWRRWK